MYGGGEFSGNDYRFYLYVNHGQKLFRKAFSDTYITAALRNEISQQVDTYLNTRGGTLISDIKAPNAVEPYIHFPAGKGVYDNFTDEELLQTKVAYKVKFVYNVKSDIYGKAVEERSFDGVYLDRNLTER